MDLYAGRQFKLARDLAAKGWDVLVLSAKHGLIDGKTKIATYDQKMTPQRAAELADDDLQADLMRIWGQDADQIVFYGGALYHHAFEALISRTGLARVGDGREVANIIGAGCGDHYSVLKQVAA